MDVQRVLRFALGALWLARLIAGQSCGYTYTGGSVVIPDSHGGKGTPGQEVFATVSIPDMGTVSKVTLKFTIVHTYDEDLWITLVHPDGTRARIATHPGHNGIDMINTMIDDAASTAINSGTAPFTGTYKPQEPFTVFNGKPTQGVWKLSIIDAWGANIGHVDSFELTFSGVSLPVCPPAPACSGVCGDPHFSGLDGVKYQFAGVVNKIFALVSDPTTELNAKFVAFGARKAHFVGETCLRVCNDTLVVRPPHYVLINGHAVAIGTRHETPRLLVERKHKHSVEVTVANRWMYTFNVGEHVDIAFVSALYDYDNKTHGVLGHTLKHRDAVAPVKCNPAKEGGCEVEGDYLDYMVRDDDLCSVDWPMSQFDADSCMF